MYVVGLLLLITTSFADDDSADRTGLATDKEKAVGPPFGDDSDGIIMTDLATDEEKAVGWRWGPSCPRCKCNNAPSSGWGFFTDCVAQSSVGDRRYSQLICFDDFRSSLSGHLDGSGKPDLIAMERECHDHMRRARNDQRRNDYGAPTQPWWQTWDWSKGPNPLYPGLYWNAEAAAAGEEKAVGQYNMPSCPRCKCNNAPSSGWGIFTDCVAQDSVGDRPYNQLYCFDDFRSSLSGHLDGSGKPDLIAMGNECHAHFVRARNNRRRTDYGAPTQPWWQTWDWDNGPNPLYPGMHRDAEVATDEEKAVGWKPVPTCPLCQCDEYDSGLGMWTGCAAETKDNKCVKNFCRLYCFDDFRSSLSGHPMANGEPNRRALGNECSAHQQRVRDENRRNYYITYPEPWWKTWDWSKGPNPLYPRAYWTAEAAAAGEEKAVGQYKGPSCPKCQCSIAPRPGSSVWTGCHPQSPGTVCHLPYCGLQCFDDFRSSLSGIPRGDGSGQPDLKHMSDECAAHKRRAWNDYKRNNYNTYNTRDDWWKTWDWSKGPNPLYPGLYWNAEAAAAGEEKAVGQYNMPSCPRCKCNNAPSSGYGFFTDCVAQGSVGDRPYNQLYCFDDFRSSLSGHLDGSGKPDLIAMGNECYAHQQRARNDFERSNYVAPTQPWWQTWDWDNGPNPLYPGMHRDAEASEAAMTANAVTQGSSGGSLAINVLAAYGLVVVLYGGFRYFTKSA